LDQILANQKEEIMDLAALTAQVTQNTTVEQSAITLIQGLAAQLVANANDPAAIAALAASLNTSATSLAAAVTANTPAA
jgi:glutamate-1-semialdehyde aminotransferase